MQPADFVLQMSNLGGDLLKVVGVLEIIGAAVGGIKALEVEVSASLAGGFAIAFDLATFAFITVRMESAKGFIPHLIRTVRGWTVDTMSDGQALAMCICAFTG